MCAFARPVFELVRVQSALTRAPRGPAGTERVNSQQSAPARSLGPTPRATRAKERRRILDEFGFRRQNRRFPT